MIFGDKKKILPHEAVEYFWALGEFNVVPVITWSFDGNIITTNQAYLDLIGYTREDFEKGRISWRKITPKEYLSFDEKCIEELKVQRIATTYEKIYIRKDGEKIWVRLHNASADFGAAKKGVAIIIGIDGEA